MSTFYGSFDELKAIVAACSLTGEWFENVMNHYYSFRAHTGEILNWWPNKGTVNFQGKRPDQFRARFLSVAPAGPLQRGVWRPVN
jgi:hypothetical protein